MAGWEVRFSDPRKERLLRVSLVLLLLALPGAFLAGHWRASEEAGQAFDDYRNLRASERLQAQELRQLRQRMAVLESSEHLARQATEQSRQTIKLLEEQIYELQQEVASYKEILAPAGRREGLRIRAFELQATDTPRLFRYKLLLSRVGRDDQPLRGRLQVSVQGRQNGKEATLSLESLSREFTERAIPFAFKHFQSFPEGGQFASLELPEGFAPRQVKVRAEIKGQTRPLERTFKWIAGE